MPVARGARALLPAALAVAGLVGFREDLFSAVARSGVPILCLSWAFAVAVVLSPAGSVVALGAAAALGTTGAAAFVLEPDGWLSTVLLVAATAVARPAPRRVLVALTTLLWIPMLLLCVARLGGLADSEALLLRTLRHALRAGTSPWMRGAVFSAGLWLLATMGRESGDAATDRHGTLVAVLSFVALAAALGARAARTLALALSHADVREWSEPPILADILALTSHVPLYRAPSLVDSYTYSPGIALLHAALLAPFGKALRPEFHHALVVAWQLLTVAVLASALAPRLSARTGRERGLARGSAALALLGILWASPASPGLHPDHVLHLGIALAVALLLRRGEPSARAFSCAVVLLPVALSAFKLTGVGVGLGFFLVLLLQDRDRRALVLFGASLGLIALTIPLFDALFGEFSTYAIGLMAAHPVYLHRLAAVLVSGPGLVVLAACVVAVLGPRDARDVRRLALFSLGISLSTTLGYLKEGGSWNNLVAATLPASCALILAAHERAGQRHQAVSVVALALVLVGAIPPPFGFTMTDRRAQDADHATAVRVVRADLAEGRVPLVLGSTTVWVEAGGQGIPRDSAQSAVELFMAKRPGFEEHLARIASGRFSTIVAQGRLFAPMSSLERPVGELYRAAVAPRYCVVAPLDTRGRPVPLTLGTRLLVLRRRDLGCEPVGAAAGVGLR